MMASRNVAGYARSTITIRFAFLAFISSLMLPALWDGQVAFAHAKLIRSSPAQAEHLDILPANIVLEFTEPVGLEFSEVQLFSGDRQKFPAGDLTRSGGRDTTVSLPLDDQSFTGLVYVAWRAVSSVDSHLMSGSYWFSVGAGSENITPEGSGFPVAGDDDGTPLEGTASAPDLPRLLARILILASSALLLGGPVFTLLVIEPSAVQHGERGELVDRLARTRLAAIGAGAAGLLALALLVDILTQTAIVAGTDYAGALTRLDMTQLLLSSTRYGFAWILKLLASLSLASLMLFAWATGTRKTSNIWEIAIAGASLLFLAEVLSSHAAAAQGGSIGGLPVPVLSDWLHMVAASLWAGGLIYMVAILFPAMKASGMEQAERSAFLRSSIPRFSRLAVVSVLTLAVTGSYNLLVHTSDARAVFDSNYGWVLMLKVILFTALVMLGARSFRVFRHTPMGSGSERQENIDVALGRNVRVEVVLVLVALSCAAALTLLPPP
ncbi:MAG: CopD family protein [Chloroflexia bacterium]